VKGREWYQADEIAEEYENKRFSRGGQLIDRREKRAVLSALGPVEDQEVLEIACGTGRFTVMLAERGADVVGLDISKPMLQQGRRKAAAANSRVDWLRGDAARLPFPDDSFDTVLAMRFFHLADTPAAFLSELRRVSRNRVVFDTFNSGSTRSVYNWLLPMGSRLYSRAEVEGLLARSALELVGADHDFVLPYGLYRQTPNLLAAPLRSLDRAVGRLPGGHRLASVSWWEARVPGADDAEPTESVARTETTGPAPSDGTGEPADPDPETAADGGERGSEPDSDSDPEPEPETAD
jgi:ubiquinone/menaquinone biosynthesis C-methylase UbiE